MAIAPDMPLLSRPTARDGVHDVDARPIRDAMHRFQQVALPPPYRSAVLEAVVPVGDGNRRALVDYLLSLPQDTALRIFRSSESMRHVRDNAATHRSLERIYTGPSSNEAGSERSWSRVMLENIRNAMAVRNRLRIVAEAYGKFIDERKHDRRGIQTLSIAAGSSRAILEVAAQRKDPRLQLRLTDITRNALADCQRLAAALNVTNPLRLIRSHFSGTGRYLESGYRPDFIEIVGLMDYLTDGAIVQLLAAVRAKMSPGGRVIYSNIAPNDEQVFIHAIVGWPPMVYRSPEQLQELGRQAGFRTMTLVQEPLAVYHLVVAAAE
jgi:hypothetical protein